MRPGTAWLSLASLLASTAAAQPAAPPVDAAAAARPVEYASYHVPTFSNDYVTVLNVFIPSKRDSGYHRHSLDTIAVLMSDSARTNQTLGAEPIARAAQPRGTVTFTAYLANPLVHTVAVHGEPPFHNLVVELLDERRTGYSPGMRSAPYRLELDNEVVRVWRLVLDPGQAAPEIAQRAPGVRIVIDGGELVEIDGGWERGMAPRSADVFWQEAGATRAVKNIGTTRIELVELELK